LRQARNERRFPGEGDCDLHGLLRSLPANIPLSLEIPTVKLLEQGVSGLQRAQRALDRTRELLAQL
jgi:sugar phosphate isomerase/epimerase